MEAGCDYNVYKNRFRTKWKPKKERTSIQSGERYELPLFSIKSDVITKSKVEKKSKQSLEPTTNDRRFDVGKFFLSKTHKRANEHSFYVQTLERSPEAFFGSWLTTPLASRWKTTIVSPTAMKRNGSYSMWINIIALIIINNNRSFRRPMSAHSRLAFWSHKNHKTKGAKNMSAQNVKTVSIALLFILRINPCFFLLPIYDAFQREIAASGAATAINWYFYDVFIDITLLFDNTNKVMSFHAVLISTKRFYSSTFFYWFRLIEGWREKNSNKGHL